MNIYIYTHRHKHTNQGTKIKFKKIYLKRTEEKIDNNKNHVGKVTGLKDRSNKLSGYLKSISKEKQEAMNL